MVHCKTEERGEAYESSKKQSSVRPLKEKESLSLPLSSKVPSKQEEAKEAFRAKEDIWAFFLLRLSWLELET